MTGVVATVWCGACVAERRRERSRLGTVETNEFGDTVWNGYVSAIWSGRRPTRSEARAIRQPRILTSGEAALMGATPPLPERLPAYCRRHGHGSVATGDILAARGSMSVQLAPQ